MTLKNTVHGYGIIARSLHWVMAVLVLALLSIGFFMTSMDFSPVKLQVYGLHKSFGFLVFFLGIGRVLWRFANPKVEELETHQLWEKILAKISHFLLYAALFLMPLSGWLMSSAADFPAMFFGLFDMPDLVSKDEDLFKILRQAHEIFAYIIIGVVGLHIAGAFKHHFIDRDVTLQRMTTRRLGFFTGGLLALVVGFLLFMPLVIVFLSSAPAAEQQSAKIESHVQAAGVSENLWLINPETSVISFEATQYGQAFSGKFKNFTGDIMFDPDNLAVARARILIDIASIGTGSAERDVQARSAEWFAVQDHPQAVFETESFERRAANQYTARGSLTIRGVTLPVELPFSLAITPRLEGGETATMDAALTLNRLDFGIGQGPWESPETIGNAVKITVHLEAAQAVTP